MSCEAPRTQRVLVAVASYNERLSLPKLLEEVFRVIPTADVLVIDDASPDGTGAYCDELAQKDVRLKCIHRSGKLGLGTAILASFEYAIANHYDWLVGLDADLSHPPQKIPELLENAKGCDVAIGSRYVAGGGVQGWPPHRRIASRMINWFARYLLGLPVRDCSGGFRCYRVEALAPVLKQGLQSGGYAIFEEVLLRLAENGASFKEIPYLFIDRAQGKSKLSLRESHRAIVALTSLALKRLTRSRRRSSANRR